MRKNFGVIVCYILLGLIIVSSFVLTFNQTGFAASSEIQSTIEPVRYVYFNNNNKIEKILSNSSLVPTKNIHWLDNNYNSVKSSKIMKLQYDYIIKNINLNHFGQIYSAPTNNNIFSKLKKFAGYLSVLPNNL